MAHWSGQAKVWELVIPNPKLKLMDQVRAVLRVKHYAIRTEQAYCDWAKDRYTVLPESLIPELRQHLERVQLRHQEDLREGFGSVYLPGALDRKYPSAAREWRWQYVFPARDRSTDPRSGAVRRHHLDEATI